MDNDIENIFKRQADIIPIGVREFIASGDWEKSLDDIIEHNNLSSEQASSLSTDTMLVLTGLIHPDDFHGEIKERISVDGAVIDSITNEIEEKIFAPIRADLVDFFEEQGKLEEKEMEQASVKTPANTGEKMPDAAPDNLPTGGEGENLIIPNLISKPTTKENGETHPFEEKMKKVFTGTSTSMGDLVIETPALTVKDDPYREPIE